MSTKDEVNIYQILLARLFYFSLQIVTMNDPNEPEEAELDCCSILLMTFSIILIVLTFPISIFFCIRIVPEYERAIIFRLGRLKKVNINVLSN